MAFQRVQSLVGAAGDWMAGDPLTTAVGAKISAATDEGLLMEDWSLNMEICDMTNSTEEGPTYAIRAIKRRLQNCVGKSHKSTLLTLIVLETCVKNCGKPFHLLVCQKDFTSELFNRVISPGVEVSTSIQDRDREVFKMLSLIQSWAHAFSPDPDLRGAAEVYMDLKKKGVDFPTPSDEDLLLVQSCQMPSVVSPARASSSASSASTGSTPSRKTPKSPVGGNPMVGSLGGNPMVGSLGQKAAKGRPEQRDKVAPSGKLTQGQLRKLERDLEIARRNMDVLSELLTELTPGQEHPEDRRLLLDVSATCREMQARILELIGLVQHRELTASLLEINDHMNNQLLRFERYKNNSLAERPQEETPVSPDSTDGGAFSPDEVLSLTLPTVAGPTPSHTTDPASLTRTGAKETDFREIEAWMAQEGGEAALLAMIGEDPSQTDSPRGEGSGDAEATTEEFDRFLQKRVEAVVKK